VILDGLKSYKGIFGKWYYEINCWTR
jgi:hypothetical protein